VYRHEQKVSLVFNYKFWLPIIKNNNKQNGKKKKKKNSFAVSPGGAIANAFLVKIFDPISKLVVLVVFHNAHW
jgi:hypothetical protein